MILSVMDIVKDLGVSKITVWRWLKAGEIKGTLTKRRHGWKITEEDYRTFLDAHPKWRIVHNKEAYRRDEIELRKDTLEQLRKEINEVTDRVLKEEHDPEWFKGFRRAVISVETVIDRNVVRRVPA